MDTLQFSDGEISVELGDNVRGRDVYIIQSTSTPCNDHVMELLIALDALKRASAGRITAVIPYFGYSRQDRKARSRVPITAKLMADLITAAGANRVLTLDLHAGQIMGFFNIPVDNLMALPIVYTYLKRKYGKDDPMVVSPDVGGVERARQLATRLDNADIAIIDKRRTGPNQVAEMNVVGDVAGRACLLVDDMVDTAGTLCKAAETLVAQGASKVIACCSHPVLSGKALERLNSSPVAELVTTDSIPIRDLASCPKITVLSVAPIFGEAIKRIHNEDSISSLFR